MMAARRRPFGDVANRTPSVTANEKEASVTQTSAEEDRVLPPKEKEAASEETRALRDQVKRLLKERDFAVGAAERLRGVAAAEARFCAERVEAARARAEALEVEVAAYRAREARFATDDRAAAAAAAAADDGRRLRRADEEERRRLKSVRAVEDLKASYERSIAALARENGGLRAARSALQRVVGRFFREKKKRRRSAQGSS